MRKALASFILVSMMLHLTVRMGFVSYLYESRHDIAFELGLIDERPIAMCSSDFFESGNTLTLNESNMEDQQLPAQLSQISEIMLFAQQAESYVTRSVGSEGPPHNTAVITSEYGSLLSSLFRPPCSCNIA